MTLHEFSNRVRSLYNIDHDKLPELSDLDWHEFRDNPPRYFINLADKVQAEAIWREVEKRQEPPPPDRAREALKNLIDDVQKWCDAVDEDSSWDGWDHHYKALAYSKLDAYRRALD